MRELDLVLERFLDSGYSQLDEADRARFETLLATQDDTLFGWFYQGEVPEDASMAQLVERIRGHYGFHG